MQPTAQAGGKKQNAEAAKWRRSSGDIGSKAGRPTITRAVSPRIKLMLRRNIVWQQQLQTQGFAAIPDALAAVEIAPVLGDFNRAQSLRSRAGVRHALKIDSRCRTGQELSAFGHCWRSSCARGAPVQSYVI